MRSELLRQVVHIVFGLFLVALAHLTTTPIFIGVCVAILIGGVILAHNKQSFIFKFFAHLERDHMKEKFHGKGAFAMVFGALLTTIIFPGQLLPALLILAIPDGIATIAGIKFGKKPMFKGTKKTWVGSGAFFASAAIILGFYTSWWSLGAIILTFLEFVDYHDIAFLDDNILLPLATGAFLIIF